MPPPRPARQPSRRARATLRPARPPALRAAAACSAAPRIPARSETLRTSYRFERIVFSEGKNASVEGAGMAERHGFHRAPVTRIVKETADSRTYVLAPEEQPFSYRAGQYCTFRVTVDGEELYRSYSMSSAPETDPELATTVKRVATGKVSNWMLDNLVEGDEVVLTRPAGTFCLDPTSTPLLGF